MSAQYPNIDQSTDVHNALLQYGYPQTGDFNSLAPMPENLETDALARVPRDLIEAQENINIPDADPNFIESISSLYRWPNLASNPSYMVQLPENFYQPSFELTESGNLSSLLSFPDVMIHGPSAIGTFNHSNIHQTGVTQYTGIGRGSSPLWDGGSLAPTIDSIWLQDRCDFSRPQVSSRWLKHIGSSLIPSENDYGYFMNDGVDYFVTNTHREIHGPEIPSVMLMSEAPISMPFQAVYSSPGNEGSSLPNDLQYGIGYFPAEKNDELPPPQNHQSIVPKSQITINSSSQKRHRQLSPNEEVGSQPSRTAKKPQKQRRLMSKSDTIIGGAAVGNEKKSKKRGRLSDEERRQRKIVRGRTACTRCFASHLACSSADPRGPCDECIKVVSSPSSKTPCLIEPLQVYHDVLSPRFLNDFLPITTQRARNSVKFIENEIEVQVSTGGSHPPITLLACEYISLSSLPLNATPDKNQILKELPSLNYGIREEHMFQIKAKILQHINAVASSSTVLGNKNTLSWKVLSVICRFHQTDPGARQNSFLGTAIAVNRLNYILGQSIIFDTDTVLKAVQSLQNEVPIDPLTSIVTAKFLAAQLKEAMVSLLNDMTKYLLYEYSSEARRNNQKNWLVCLLTHLILCACGELIEIQVDGFIPFIITSGDFNPEAIRGAGTGLCRKIDHAMLNHSWDLIRAKMRNRLQKRNPFIYGCEVLMDESGGEVLSQTEQNVINEIRQIMNDDEEITRKLSYPLCGGSSRTFEEHIDFREHNSGRLVAKYLRVLERKGKL